MTADDTDCPTGEPDAPDSLPTYLVDGVSKQDADTLRELAAYATAMADWQEAEAQQKLESDAEHDTDTVPDAWDEDEWKQQLEEARAEADVSGQATLTTKTIDGHDYYYLQWRDGDSTPSKYVAPVVPASSN
ncbi:hypothetical protein RYH80_19130 [Halobaculum sp. MBLA0147]|uniref:hypothetical protein n=1 Tax=Halobaculum sp. MBLA0147 TaxID=3079934 RepID=UPI0035268718